MQHLYLIRHGATVANTQNLCCGKSDLPLCPEGEKELRKLMAKGGYPSVEGKRLITSGMQRTVQTAAVLFPGVESESEPAFREIDFGDFELQSYQQLKEREDYQQWLEGDNARNRCPGGESGEDVANRVRPALDALIKDGRDAVLVTHGGVIATIMTDLYPQSNLSRYEWQGEPGHGWAVTFEAGKPVKCEPIPDAYLNEERTIARKWAWIALGFVGGALGAVMLAAYSAMQGTRREALWFAVAAALIAVSQVLRFTKLRCPYCGKSAAPLKPMANPRLACPRCGRIYRFEE